MQYRYTSSRVKSNIWYDRAIRRAFRNKVFTRQEFETKFVSMYLMVADDSNINTAKLKSKLVFAKQVRTKNIVEKVHEAG